VPPQGRLSEVLFTLNAATTSDGIRAFPANQPGLVLRNNVDCTTSACFADPLSLNFSPIPISPLTRVRSMAAAGLPQDDYFGRGRHGRSTAGAIAFSAPAIELGIKNKASIP
jgi:hypothetical protein